MTRTREQSTNIERVCIEGEGGLVQAQVEPAPRELQGQSPELADGAAGPQGSASVVRREFDEAIGRGVSPSVLAEVLPEVLVICQLTHARGEAEVGRVEEAEDSHRNLGR